MSIVNSIKKSIKFSGDFNQYYWFEASQQYDLKMIQINLLGFLKDYDSLFNLFYEKNCSGLYIQQIYIIVWSAFVKLKSESTDRSNKYRNNYLKKTTKMLRNFIYNQNTTDILLNCWKALEEKHEYCIQPNKRVAGISQASSSCIINTIKNTVHSILSLIVKFNEVEGEQIFLKPFNLN